MTEDEKVKIGRDETDILSAILMGRCARKYGVLGSRTTGDRGQCGGMQFDGLEGGPLVHGSLMRLPTNTRPVSGVVQNIRYVLVCTVFS